MISDLFNLKYSQQFHCVHFVIAAAKEIYGLDYSPCFVGLTKPLDESLRVSRKREHQNKKLTQPQEGCIVLMKYPSGSSHVGLFFRNRVFHLIERGVEQWSLDYTQITFNNRVYFYEPNLLNQQ